VAAEQLPPDLALATERIAALIGVRAATLIGRDPLELDVDLSVRKIAAFDTTSTEIERDGLAIVYGAVPWDALGGARVVLASEQAADANLLDVLARIEAEAAGSGWRVAYAGLLPTGGGDPARRERPLVVACRPDDETVARALDNGPLSLALDPAARSGGGDRAARVLIASFEIAGPTGNGGIGTAYHSLAFALAAAGHDVTVLFTGWFEPDRRSEEPAWREAFAAAGIAFELLGSPWDVPVRSPHHAVRRAYELHRWLAEAHDRRPFDVVHVPECQGHGAFAQTAKALGLAYADVEFVVGTHSSTRWIGEANREALEDVDLLVTEHLERLSVERADVVMSPSAYLVDYMRQRGWRLPRRTFVQPYARPRSVRRLADETAAQTPAPPRELVFFGRLETRKGLELFCDAVEILVAEGDCPFERVTFLGRPERVMGEDSANYVTRRAESWGLAWTVMADLGHEQAVSYLRSHACVVAIPSLVDNSPNTVSEAIALGVPFVASRSGGTAELIAPRDRAAATFDGRGAAAALEPPTFSDAEHPFDARSLAVALRAKAADPSTRASPAVDADACDRAYDAWHRAIAARPPTARPPAAERPLDAAVCIVSADAEEVVRIADAVRGGTRPPAQLVAHCDLSEAAARDLPADIAFVRAAGRDQGRVRAAASAALDADVLIVVRGNEQPDADLVERVCTAMAGGDADVLALVSRDPESERGDLPSAELRRHDVPRDLRAFVPAAGPAVAAIAYPALSVGSYAIRREAFARLGCYAHDVWGDALDHELLARAALAGMRIDVLPDPLATTLREDRWCELRSRYWGHVPVPVPRGEQQIHLLRPFRRLLPPELTDLPALLSGALRAGGATLAKVGADADLRRELVDAYEARVGEQRELIALYERRQEELRAELARHVAAQPPAAGAPGQPGRRLPEPLARGVRFARWRLKQLTLRRRR